MSSLEALRERLVRPAVLFEPSQGFGDPGSFFAHVDRAAAGEEWPRFEGKPMVPLLQLNLDELVYRPAGTEDIRFLTLFVAPNRYPENEPNGTTWVLRAYTGVSKLVALPAPCGFEIKPTPLGPPVLVEDYPCFDDLEEEIEDDLWDEFQEQHQTVSGIKLGGWPSLIQSDIHWAPNNEHPAEPAYVLQVDSFPEAGWQWGDAGCAYIGRGTKKGYRKEWTFDWQCF